MTPKTLSALGVVLLCASATAVAAQSRKSAARRAPAVEVLTPTVTAEENASRARARVKITMYSAGWCGVCRAARDYFQRQGVHFVERDVERDASARKRHRALSPRGSLPTIEIDGQLMEGFSPKAFEELMTAATEQRLEENEARGPKTFEIRWR